MSVHDNKTYKVALDAMGGDFAPTNEIQGAILAFDEKDVSGNLEIVFVGIESKIQAILDGLDKKNLKYSIVHADEVITMDDDPTAAIKKKKNSSLYIGLEMLANRSVDAFISACNTGAMLSTATVLLGRIKGVSRPTIGSFFPSQTENLTFVLDVGANVDVKARYLFEFAVMGSIYLNQMAGIQNPRVGLMNIGEEESKGSEILQQTYQMLKQSNLNFVGNVEGRDILNGSCDVVICDGFTGNVVLKFAESVYGLIKSKIKDYSKAGLKNKFMLMLSAPVFKKIFKDFDYQSYGGVPILGVNGVAIVGHGKSTPRAVKNMIIKALEQVRKDVNSKIENALNSNDITN